MNLIISRLLWMAVILAVAVLPMLAPMPAKADIIARCLPPDDWYEFARETGFVFVEMYHDELPWKDYPYGIGDLMVRYANPETLQYIIIFTNDFGRYCVADSNIPELLPRPAEDA